MKVFGNCESLLVGGVEVDLAFDFGFGNVRGCLATRRVDLICLSRWPGFLYLGLKHSTTWSEGRYPMISS